MQLIVYMHFIIFFSECLPIVTSWCWR